jgi:hypothetical protein
MISIGGAGVVDCLAFFECEVSPDASRRECKTC